MNTLGWILILVGILFARAVSKGRIMNVGEDMSDALLAVVRGDNKGLSEVLAREGDGYTPGVVGSVVGSSAGNAATEIAGGLANAALASAIVKLGEAAKGYRWEGTGPDYYDCSGLVWRACRAIGFTGSRFTTATIRSITGSFKVISPPGMQGPGVTAAMVNDIVLWPAGSGGITGHMGVVTGNDMFYSARSVRSGIGNSKISTFRSTKPIYLRYVGRKSGIFSDPFKKGA